MTRVIVQFSKVLHFDALVEPQDRAFCRKLISISVSLTIFFLLQFYFAMSSNTGNHIITLGGGNLEAFGIVSPDRVVVQHVTQDGIVHHKAPPAMEADDPLQTAEILVTRACDSCKKYFPSADLKFCSSCKTGGPYCGRQCQIKGWKAGHRQQCKANENSPKDDSIERASRKLLELLFAYADVRCIHHPIHGLMSISDVCRNYFQPRGPGILILQLRDGIDLEQFIFEIQLFITGQLTKDFDGIRVPQHEYVPIGEVGRSPFLNRLQALGIDSVVKNLTLSQYVLGIVTGDIPALHALVFEQNTAGIPKPKKLVSTMARSADLCEKIQTDPAFAQCRKHMSKLKTKPGVVWIRNIFDHKKHDYERGELNKVTPELLSRDLIQYQLDVATRAVNFMRMLVCIGRWY